MALLISHAALERARTLSLSRIGARIPYGFVKEAKEEKRLPGNGFPIPLSSGNPGRSLACRFGPSGGRVRLYGDQVRLLFRKDEDVVGVRVSLYPVELLRGD